MEIIVQVGRRFKMQNFNITAVLSKRYGHDIGLTIATYGQPLDGEREWVLLDEDGFERTVIHSSKQYAHILQFFMPASTYQDLGQGGSFRAQNMYLVQL